MNNKAMAILLASLGLAACGGGGGGGGTPAPDAPTVSLTTVSGTVPGTVIEAFGDNGSYYRTTSTENGTTQHPFSLQLPAGIGFRLVMTINEGTPDSVSCPIGFRDGTGQVRTRLKFAAGSATVNLGHVPLPVTRDDARDDWNGDGILDVPFVLDDHGANNPLRQIDADGDGADDFDDADHGGYQYEAGTVDPQDIDGDGVPNAYEDEDGDGSPNISDDDDDGDGIADDVDPDSQGDADDDGLRDEVDVNPSNDPNDDNRFPSDRDSDNDGYLDGDDDHDGYDDDDADHDGSVADDLGGGGGGTSTATTYKVLAANDLGMHCVDKDFSVFSILPPFNTVNAQVVKQPGTGLPVLLGADQVELRYSPISDATGSINSTSKGKSNFWDYVSQVYGANLPVGQGLTGRYMPADAPTPDFTSFDWSARLGMFSADGIPILPVDDAGRVNRYPLMRVTAYEKASGKQLAYVDVVLPVSEETTCSNCHATGKTAATSNAATWADDADLEVQTRKNVLLLHDARHGTDLMVRRPVLCASCHYSPALDLAGTGPNADQQPHKNLSQVLHAFHADKMKDASGAALPDAPVLAGQLPPPADQQSCYQCHPGADTKCLRGAMSETLSCQNCHGDMKAVGAGYPLLAGGSVDGANDGQPRRPWQDLPRCQSCHTGDAVDHMTPADPHALSADTLRLLVAYVPNDPSASPLKAANTRFAEEPNKLYRFSKGHGGVSCESCHGSTHAIWENGGSPANDNQTAQMLQKHAGAVTECTTCHAAGSLPLTLNGPHGMHNVADARWTDGGHGDMYERNAASCKACHGADLKGTVLSRAATDRTFVTEDFGAKTFKKGTMIGCYSCHNGPDDD